jgi:hypoxanthine phosphoribosyltransferase
MAKIGKIVLTKEQIQQRVKELGAELKHDYGDLPLTAVGILKGAVVFMADLARNYPGHMEFDFMACSSYGRSTHTSGEVRILKDLEESIEGKHILLVEDIVDTGLTLSYLLEVLKSRRPASIKICCLLDKPSRRLVPIKVDYCGFQIEDLFVIGYGLDYASEYRNLPYVAVLEPDSERESNS